MQSTHSIDFFLGSKTMSGFRSLFSELLRPEANYQTYVLKGGPGTGKSTFMKRVAETFLSLRRNVEYVPCASDPRSLDAVVDHESRVAILDGTSPHMIDPVLPGVGQTIINLGEAWDGKLLLSRKDEIVRLIRAVDLCHARAGALISAAGALLTHSQRVAEPYVDHGAILAFARDFLAMPYAEPDGVGREQKRLLSAVSADGVVFFENTLTTLCPKLYVLSDPAGPAAHALLSRLRADALSASLDAIVCPCSVLAPEKLEHLLLPEIGVGFTTANAFHAAAREDAVTVTGLYRTIPTFQSDGIRRFTEQAEALVASATREITCAKSLHDELETLYADAMDFSVVEKLRARYFPAADRGPK